MDQNRYKDRHHGLTLEFNHCQTFNCHAAPAVIRGALQQDSGVSLSEQDQADHKKRQKLYNEKPFQIYTCSGGCCRAALRCKFLGRGNRHHATPPTRFQVIPYARRWQRLER